MNRISRQATDGARRRSPRRIDRIGHVLGTGSGESVENTLWAALMLVVPAGIETAAAADDPPLPMPTTAAMPIKVRRERPRRSRPVSIGDRETGWHGDLLEDRQAHL